MRKFLLACIAFTALLFGADALRIRIGSPVPAWESSGTIALSTHTLDAANDAVDFVFYAPADVTVTTLCVNHSTNTGSARQYILQLASVDGSGLVSTIRATAMVDPVTAAWGANTFQCAAISHDGAGGALSNYAISQGTPYSIRILPCQDTTAPCTDSTAPDGSNTLVLNVGQNASLMGRPLIPFVATTNGGTRSKTGFWPLYGYKSASATYGNAVQSMSVGTTISSGSSIGYRWTLPAGHGQTYKVAGVEWSGQAAAGKNVRIALYPGSSTTEISNCATVWDTDVGRTSAAAMMTHLVFFPSTCGALDYGTEYRVDFSPQDAGTNFAVVTFTFAAAGDMTGFPGGGWFSGISRSSCTGVCDTESFTNDTTIWPHINLVLSDITEPAGGGSVIGGGFAIAQ